MKQLYANTGTIFVDTAKTHLFHNRQSKGKVKSNLHCVTVADCRHADLTVKQSQQERWRSTMLWIYLKTISQPKFWVFSYPSICMSAVYKSHTSVPVLFFPLCFLASHSSSFSKMLLYKPSPVLPNKRPHKISTIKNYLRKISTAITSWRTILQLPYIYCRGIDC